MKITKKALKEIKKQTNNKLKKYVCNYFLTENNIEDSINNLFTGGCENGAISSLIYESDTISFFEKYKEEINELLVYILEGTGWDIKQLFREKWDITDPLATDIPNKNLLAWFGFKEMTSEVARELGMED